MHISDKSIRNVKSRKYSLPMNLHKKQFVFGNNNNGNHLKFGLQLLGLTLRVNPWLWNLARCTN